MKTYIGTKIIQAEPAFRIDGEIYPESGPVPRSMNREEGYRVHYPDGYESWSPKDVFERAYLPLTVNPDLRTDAPSISQQMVDDFILETWTQTMGDKTTVVRALLRNGFEIVESSACVSAENYDEKLGREICLGKIKDKVWFLLGFLLQTAVHGVKKAENDAKPTGGVSFGLALEAMKKGKGARLPHWKPDVVIWAQYPDEHSKMTAPYLYVESRYGRVPWKETMIELFSEDWEIVEGWKIVEG